MSNNREPYYPQWVQYHALLEEDYSHLSFDLGLMRLLPVPDKENVLQILLKIKAPNKDGLPSEEETETLERMGKELEKAYSAAFDVIPIGYVIAAGVCGFYFFVGSIIDYEKIAETALADFPEYSPGVNMFENDGGAVCTEMFFPCFEQFELVQHSMVITRLEEDNDPLVVPREVDHWCYFRSAEDRAAFLEIVKNEGFQVENLSEDVEQETWPYGVQMRRVDKVDRETVFEFTMNLWNLAYKHYGNYDGWETYFVKEEK